MLALAKRSEYLSRMIVTLQSGGYQYHAEAQRIMRRLPKSRSASDVQAERDRLRALVATRVRGLRAARETIRSLLDAASNEGEAAIDMVDGMLSRAITEVQTKGVSNGKAD